MKKRIKRGIKLPTRKPSPKKRPGVQYIGPEDTLIEIYVATPEAPAPGALVGPGPLGPATAGAGPYGLNLEPEGPPGAAAENSALLRSDPAFVERVVHGEWEQRDPYRYMRVR